MNYSLRESYTDPNDFLMIMKAMRLAEKAHEGQLRKYTGLKYSTHVNEVAESIMRYISFTPSFYRVLKKAKYSVGDVVSIALLHDLFEDTDYPRELLRNEFNDKVYYGVLALTDVFTKEAYPNMNRAERKKNETDRLALQNPVIQTIKGFDIDNNTESIVEHDPKFAETYMQEKYYLVMNLKSMHSCIRSKLQEKLMRHFYTKTFTNES